MADELLFTKANKIATITLNRPDQLNTFHDGMLADWAAALRECQADDAINVVVLTAAGRVFCAGGDLATMGRRDGNPAWDMGEYRKIKRPFPRTACAHSVGPPRATGRFPNSAPGGRRAHSRRATGLLRESG